MTQTLKLLIHRLSIILGGNVRPPNTVSPHVTKEEILQIFVKELPEPSPKRDAWQNA
jgi:hypothetical protein